MLEGVASLPWASCPKSLQLEDLLYCASARGQSHGDLCNSPFSTLVFFLHINSDVWVSCLKPEKEKKNLTLGNPHVLKFRDWNSVQRPKWTASSRRLRFVLSIWNHCNSGSRLMCVMHALWETIYIRPSFNAYKTLSLCFLKEEAQRC